MVIYLNTSSKSVLKYLRMQIISRLFLEKMKIN
nr:MAG TPA: hypothetical protein [Caudoviricetes sp.]